MKRREFLRGSASCMLLASTAIIPPTPVRAVEPTTIIIAAVAVASALGSLFSSGGGGGLDAATEAYLNSILDNQQKIAEQLTTISKQISDLAEITSTVPAQTNLLQEEIEAGGIHLSVAKIEKSYLEDFLAGTLVIDDGDVTSFRAHVQDIRRSASKYGDIANSTAQSLDVVASLELLRLSIETLISAAELGKHVTDGDKRNLENYLELITDAAEMIRSGGGAPRLGKFVDAHREARSMAATRAQELHSYKEQLPSDYVLSVPLSFYESGRELRLCWSVM